MSIVQFDNVSRIYTSGDHELRALDHVSFTLDEGKFVVILGPSGAGKKVKASRKHGVATFISELPVDEEKLKKSINETGYTYVSVILK